MGNIEWDSNFEVVAGEGYFIESGTGTITEPKIILVPHGFYGYLDGDRAVLVFVGDGEEIGFCFPSTALKALAEILQRAVEGTSHAGESD